MRIKAQPAPGKIFFSLPIQVSLLLDRTSCRRLFKLDYDLNDLILYSQLIWDDGNIFGLDETNIVSKVIPGRIQERISFTLV